MSEMGVLADDGRLATDLAAALEREYQDALNHPIRRDILRVLHEGDGSRSVPEILGALPPLTRGEVSYHVRVLADSGSVGVEEAVPARTGTGPLYQSHIDGDDQVRLVLQATHRGDSRLRERTEDRGPSSILTMFRLPRPSRTIRLRGLLSATTEPIQ